MATYGRRSIASACRRFEVSSSVANRSGQRRPPSSPHQAACACAPRPRRAQSSGGGSRPKRGDRGLCRGAAVGGRGVGHRPPRGAFADEAGDAAPFTSVRKGAVGMDVPVTDWDGAVKGLPTLQL